MSSGSIWTRRKKRWCCVWTRRAQIQALNRTAPVLPMMPGMPERRTHDYVRHGITTLFAALNVATGEVYGSIHRRHRATEFKKFLTKLDNDIPAELDVHLICDNYATHKSPTVANWLARPPPVSPALHPDLFLVAQPGRTMVCVTDRQEACAAARTPRESRHWKKTSATGSRTWNENPKAVHMDQNRRRDPRPTQRISTADSWCRTLGGL